MTVSSSAPNFGSMNPQTTATPPFPVPSGLPTIPGPPGLSPSSIDSTSAFLQRPSMPGHPSNAVVPPQTYPLYPSLHGIAPSPQGIWMQPQQMGGVSRPPFMHYPTVFPGPLPLPTQAIPRPAKMPDSQPPGVSPAVTVHASPTPSSAQSHHVVNVPEMWAELPPGIDTKNHSDDAGSKDNAVTTESLDAWTAHKTATGVVYYYNVVTGVSTYEKPPGFVGEPGKVPVHPTPISMENLPGTDWALVTTNDGKKYYHNVKTKLSSWQIPSEVVEVRKKQEVDLSKDVLPVPHSTLSTDKGSASSSLGTPALNTGGRDATPLRSSSTPGSSALDLIKKKLQESGAPVTSSPASASLGSMVSDLNGMRATETTKGLPSENNKDSLDDKKGNGNVSDSSTDSEDEDRGPTKEECIIQFKEMLKERGVAPFSKWEKELPKIVFDPRFKAIPSHSARRALFEHYVKTRAEEERKERRAAQKAAIEGFKQLLEEASEEIDHNTDYQTFREKWGSDPRFKVLDRKDRENLLNERVLPLKKAAKEKAQAEWAAAATSFKSMLRDRGDITVNSRWSRVKDCLRNDPRYKSVKYEDREVLFNEYISGLKAVEEEAEKAEKSKREEQDKLKERERELRKRKEREELEMERVRAKVRRKEAVTSFQALLVETIKDPQASWTESKTKLEKDPQGRASRPDLDPTDMEKLFRDHIKTLHERCVHEFKALLADVVTIEAAAKKTEDGKTVLDSWSTAKRLLKPDPRYNKMPRKERETLWRRHAEDMLRKQNSALDQKEDKHKYSSARNSADTGKYASGSRRN